MPPSASPKKATESPRKSQTERTSSSAQNKKKDPPPPAGRDIRAFFSGPTAKKPPPQPSSKGTGAAPIAIDDSNGDEQVERVERKLLATKPTASTSASKTTSKHFAASSSKKKPIVLDSSPEPSPLPPAATKTTPKVKTKAAAPAKPISAAPKAKTPTKRKLVVSDDDEDYDDVDEDEVIPPPRKRSSVARRTTTVSDNEDDVPQSKLKGKTKMVAVPHSHGDDDDDDDLDERVKPKAASKAKASPVKPVKKPPPKAAPSSMASANPSPKKQVAVAEKSEADAEKSEADAKPKPKFDFRAAAAARSAGPKAPGSKDIPEGQPGCLAGLTFVFTGELESLGREEASELAKRYFGKVTGAPSRKTSYVVVGENAGASKLSKIKELKIPTLNEDEFLELIRSRGAGQLDDKQKEQLAKEEKKVLEQAKELEAREREEEKLRKRKEAALEGTGIAAKKATPVSAQLWTTKYAPQNIREICGNKGAVEKLGQWLQDWQKNYKSGFKKPGKDGMGMYRAVLISGPPGIGKTTSAHLMATAAGFAPLELNASDARSKKLVENATNIDNASLDGFFQGKGINSTTVADVKIGTRTCLIMDEVDGMSAGDRGGVGALNGLIKKTKIPMILICNDRSLQKMKPLYTTTFNLPFRRPTAQEIRSRILSILYKEKLKIPSNVVDELVKGVNSDIRQVLNMLSTFKLSKSEMNFDEGKDLVKTNEKNAIMTPFTIIDRLTGPYAFSRTNRETLGDKMELYFHDISFVPLFMQEHYIKTNPATLGNLDGPERNLKNLELISKAADSISDGDLVDRMIHGSEQQWSLLPLHAVASTVRPAFHIYGPMRNTGGAGGGGGWGPAFPQWLGQNSKQGKLGRQLTDIQIRMRLRVSGGRDEIRQQYMPLLAGKIVTPLVDRGQDAIDDTIACMDEYYLGKEDWDAFVELGVDTMRDDVILKKIPTAVKSAFTRQYNKVDHPIAFHKGDMFAAARKKVADVGPAPDNEDVFEEDEVVPDEEESGKEDDESEVNDYTKDKLIKAVKPKGAKGKAPAKKR